LATRKYVIDGQSFIVEVLSDSGMQPAVLVNGKRYHVERMADPPAGIATTPIVSASVLPRSVRSAPGEVRAPMAGRVVHLHSRSGQSVAAGAPLIVLDAMKMENIIHAPRAGRVDEVSINVGDTVLQGALLLRLE
jgi:biotin carboxyl carrier protein